jgi:hypothetical protein
MDLDFLGFGLGPNQVFRLTPSSPSSIPGTPVWLYYDAQDPPKVVPQHGDEALNKPDWQRAYVVFDYERVEGDPFLDTDPCARSVPTDDRSWGAMKAGYDQ